MPGRGKLGEEIPGFEENQDVTDELYFSGGNLLIAGNIRWVITNQGWEIFRDFPTIRMSLQLI